MYKSRRASRRMNRKNRKNMRKSRKGRKSRRVARRMSRRFFGGFFQMPKNEAFQMEAGESGMQMPVLAARAQRAVTRRMK